MRFFKIYYTLFLFFIISFSVKSQSIRGYIFGEDNMPLSYAHVYVKNAEKGTTTNEKGYYELSLQEGNYEIVISSLGYKTITFPVILYNKGLLKNFTLEMSSVELEQVVIKATRKDPAYEVIQNAIKAKKDNIRQINSSYCNVYIKAKEVISEKERKKREKAAEQEKIEQQRTGDIEKENPVKTNKNEALKLANSMNMVEIKLERNYQYPDKVKEIRNAYEKYGTDEGLYFLSTAETEFDFYQNLIPADKLNSIPLISPLNSTSVLSYKFKLENSTFEGNKQIFHIKVSPRKPGNATFEGFIDIIDSSFAIRRVDLWLEKGGLLFYDYFRIQQEYALVNDTVWVISSQIFDYKTKSGNRDFTGNTTVNYSNYNLDIQFPKRYFKNEVAVTEKDAYDKDTTYWKENRPIPLTPEEQRFIFIKDSIAAALNRKEYLDSLDKAYNKITMGDVFLWGLGFYNREKKQHIWVGSIPSIINPFGIGGMRVGQHISYFKKFNNEKYIDSYTYIHYGIRNSDLKGNSYLTFLYNPFKLSRAFISGGKNFSVVQAYESFVGYMDRANYVESTYIQMGHSTEIFNGLYFESRIYMKQNSPIDKYRFGVISDEFVPNNKPRSFDPYQLFELKLQLKWVPFQKYLTEPKRKVVLGSKWPALTVDYQIGIPDVLGSDVDYDFIQGELKQTYKVGTVGTSTALVACGKFLRTNEMHYENYKIFPRSDKWFFSTPMQNQMQDTTFVTTDLFFEAHYVHYFNGSIINNIPFVRKLKMYETAGLNYTWIKEGKYQYMDVYVGIEKSFRIQRQLFRFGVFFVFGGSSNQFAKPQIQFSINHYDKSDGSWEN